MQNENLTKFIEGRLALIVDEDPAFIEELQDLVEQSTDLDPDCQKGNRACAAAQALRSIRKYGRDNACISFNLRGNKCFGWCSKTWYLNNEFEIMSINDFFLDHEDLLPPSKTSETEWLALIS